MQIETHEFGITSAGILVTAYEISGKDGFQITFIDYGACIVKLLTADAKGIVKDVVLGFDTVDDYENNSDGLGAFMGRVANRIAGATFRLNETQYFLDKNDGNNCLHSGFHRYENQIYAAHVIQGNDFITVEFSRLSPDMEQGFPGNVDITVAYTVTDQNELVIKYKALTDKDTLINLTNHSYFNLAGHDSGTILNQKVWLDADCFTPTNSELIPTGKFEKTAGTPMDFRIPKPIGRDIQADYEPLRLAGGYDHNFVINKADGNLKKCATLTDDISGRKMEVFTDLPGVQLYCANMMAKRSGCKDNAVYGRHSGVCFETQFFPDSCHQPHFPSCLVPAGGCFEHTTIYRFGTI